MLEYTVRTIEPFTVVPGSDLSALAPLTPVDFVELPYTPTLLLPVAFDVSITSAADYHLACKEGFYDYFSDMYVLTPDGHEMYVNHFYTRADVQREVDAVICASVTYHTSLSWSAGFYLGLFSALALTDRSLAAYGVQLLTTLVASLASRRVPSRCTGGDGWPLDR